MNAEDFTQPISELTEEAKRYFNLRINHIGLQVNKKMAEFASQLITMLVLAGIFAMIILMLSFAFVFWYGKSVGPYHHGFLIMSLVYALIGFIIYFYRDRLLLNPIIHKISEMNVGQKEEEDNSLPKVTDMAGFDKQLEIVHLQIQHSELVMQKKLNDLGDAFSPTRIINTMLIQALTSSALLMRATSILLKFLKKRKR